MSFTQFELKVKIAPQSSKNEIVGFFNGALKIKIKSTPVDSKANKDLIKFLKKEFKPNIKKIEILKGETSPNKILRVEGNFELIEVHIQKVTMQF